MKNIEYRKRQKIKEKTIIFIVLLSILAILYFMDYDFENLQYNGIILLVISFIVAILLVNDKFYIDFGVKDYDVEKANKTEEFRLFNRMHPFITIYNKFISITFFIIFAISIFMIISSFF